MQSEFVSSEENGVSESSVLASSGPESAEPEETEPGKEDFSVIGIDGNKYSINLNDIDTISHVFIKPLIACGPIWGYNWKTSEEIHADDLINFCGYANFWNFPLDFEGVYLPDQNTQKAGLVEDKILEHFDVSRAYLKTSSLYVPEEDAYQLLGGWGGGWGAGALSADLQGDLLKIEVGYFTSVTAEMADEYRLDPENRLPDGYYSPDRIIGGNGTIIIPGGTLTAGYKTE